MRANSHLNSHYAQSTLILMVLNVNWPTFCIWALWIFFQANQSNSAPMKRGNAQVPWFFLLPDIRGHKVHKCDLYWQLLMHSYSRMVPTVQFQIWVEDSRLPTEHHYGDGSLSYSLLGLTGGTVFFAGGRDKMEKWARKLSVKRLKRRLFTFSKILHKTKA